MEHFRHPVQTENDKLMAEITQSYVKEIAELREELRLAKNEVFRLTGKLVHQF